MELQIALDDIGLDAAVKLLEDVAEQVDIIEAGTPLVIEYGMEAVRVLKRGFPDKKILCDAKIMDGGTIEANAAFRAGADYVTVLGVADRATIQAVVNAAKEWERNVVVDLLCMDNFEKNIVELERLGVNMVAVHVGVDQQRSGRTPLQDLIHIKAIAKGLRVAVAGGIHSQNVAEYVEQSPDVIVVGGAICSASDPLAEAAAIQKQLGRAK